MKNNEELKPSIPWEIAAFLSGFNGINRKLLEDAFEDDISQISKSLSPMAFMLDRLVKHKDQLGDDYEFLLQLWRTTIWEIYITTYAIGIRRGVRIIRGDD